jgi:hypothetical protein
MPTAGHRQWRGKWSEVLLQTPKAQEGREAQVQEKTQWVKTHFSNAFSIVN